MVLNSAIRLLRHARPVFGQSVLAAVRPSTRSAFAPARFISISAQLFAERRYTDKHEWVQLDDTNAQQAVVGITEYAQEALGDVVFAQLPEVGAQLAQGDECGALESVKAASELYSPISGRVLAKNDAVEDAPALINSSCYDQGWLFRVHIDKAAEFDRLMDEKQYADFLKSADH